MAFDWGTPQRRPLAFDPTIASWKIPVKGIVGQYKDSWNGGTVQLTEGEGPAVIVATTSANWGEGGSDKYLKYLPVEDELFGFDG
jgi:hypothetical protein